MKHSKKIIFGLILFLSIGYISFSSVQEDLTSLIDKGELLIEQKSYAAGISVLETVVTKDPQNARALFSLLQAYDAYTVELANQKRFKQIEVYLPKMEATIQKIQNLPEDLPNSNAQSRYNREVAAAKAYLMNTQVDLKKAKTLVKLNAGRERYNQAVEQFKKRQYEVAESLLKESIELDPTNAYSYELLGEIANLNHDLNQAEQHFKKAFSLNPDPKVREKYEKIIREKELDQDQQQYSDEHFIIRYKRGEKLEGSKIREILREAYRTISQDFGYYPKYKIPVIVYSQEEYRKVAGEVPHWSAALYDGKIRLPIYQKDQSDLKKLIFHELTHAFILDLSQLKCPVWLNEGLAQVEESKARPVDLNRLILAVQNKKLIDMNELIFMDISKTQDQEKAILFYLQSYSFAKYVIDQKGFYQMKVLLSELSKSKPFLEAFESAFGRSFRDMASQWEQKIKQTYRLKP